MRRALGWKSNNRFMTWVVETLQRKNVSECVWIRWIISTYVTQTQTQEQTERGRRSPERPCVGVSW